MQFPRLCRKFQMWTSELSLSMNYAAKELAADVVNVEYSRSCRRR